MNMTIHYQLGTSLFTQSSSPYLVNFNENSLIIKAQTKLGNVAKLKVFNTNGQLVYNQVYASYHHQIDENISTINWYSGLYLVQVENAKGLVFQKKLTLVK
jgi:hypothetical protein